MVQEHMMIDRQPDSGNRAYFARRESQERRLAAAASDCAARSVHLHMADRYAALLHATTVPPPTTL
jgi:hypothetical protein